MTDPTTPHPPARLLITSVGSLVGRGLLDVLDDRREGLHLVGGDADPRCPAFAECDDWVQLPNSTDPAFVPAVEAVCRERGIELVLAGRDPDALALAPANDDPASPVRGPFAPAAMVAATRDKWATAALCERVGVPFAPSVCTDLADAAGRAADLVAAWGFPLIAKPRDGSGSLGVRVVVDAAQLERCLAAPGYLLQPFLDPPRAEALQLDTSAGLPLFWEVPVVDSPAIMAVVEPDGAVRGPLCFAVTHRLGRVEEIHRVDDPALHAFSVAAAAAFAAAGWRGPLNLPLRRGPDTWFVIEINPRFTGGTSGRFHLGFDEVGYTLNAWLGREVVPAPSAAPVARVRRILHDFPVHEPQGPE